MKSDNSTSIRESMNEGFIRGMAGKEEDTSKARTLQSSAPLPNEMLGIKKLYIVCFASMAIGIIITPLLAIGVLGLMVVYCIDSSVVDHKTQRLRRAKFKIAPNVDDAIIFEKMQQTFVTKYNMLVEKREDGGMQLTFKNYTYDILLNEDNTFNIWWRLEGVKAFAPRGKYKMYRTILEALGIIGYEIQQEFGV